MMNASKSPPSQIAGQKTGEENGIMDEKAAYLRNVHMEMAYVATSNEEVRDSPMPV